MENEAGRTPTMILQLQEVSKLYHTFLEWRHKVLLRFGVVLAAVAVAANGYFSADAATRSKAVVLAALLAGSVFSVVAALMDRRNEEMIESCRALGSKIEGELEVAEFGLFCHLVQEPRATGVRRFGRYRYLMQLLYLSTAALLALVTVYVAIIY